MKSIKPNTVIVILIIALPIILLSPILLPGKAMFWGTPMLQFVPWWSQAWHTLQLGQIPLWNPMLGLGAPLLANYQTALLYPPTWLLFGFAWLGDVPGLAYGVGWLIAGHLIWVGFGMRRLIKELGWNELAQVVGAIAFSLSGYLVGRTHFPSMIFATVWLPWIIWGVTRIVNQRTWRRALTLTAMLTMLLLAGHAQTAWYTIVFTGVWVIFWHHLRFGWQSIWRPVLIYIGSGFAAGVLAATQLAPTIEYMQLSQRATALDLEQAMVYSFWPWRLLGLIAPNLFGNPAHGDYWGYAAFWEDHLFIGLLAFLVALFFLLKKDKGKVERGFSRLLIGVFLVTFLLGLGDNTPIFPWIYENIPTFDLFKSPTRYLLLFEFTLILLAALGVDHWRKPEGRGLYWARLGTMGSFAIVLGAGLGVVVMGQFDIDPELMRPTFVPAIGWAGIGALGFALINLHAPQAGLPSKKWWPTAVVAVLALELLVAGWGLNPAIDVVFYESPSALITDLGKQTVKNRVYLTPEAEYNLTYERFLNFESFAIDEAWGNARLAMLPNLPSLDRIQLANNFDPIVPASYVKLMGRLVNGEVPSKLLGIGLIVKASEEYEVQLQTVGGVSRAQWLTPNQTPEIEWLLDSPNKVLLRVTSDEAGGLLLADLDYPGWNATINGEIVDIHPFLEALRVVDVPAGENIIEFVYRPWTFYGGLIASVLGWVVWGLLWMRYRKQDSED